MLWHNNSINRFEIVLYKLGLDIKPKKHADKKKQDYIYIIYDIPWRQSWQTPILVMILWYIYLPFSALQKNVCPLVCKPGGSPGMVNAGERCSLKWQI